MREGGIPWGGFYLAEDGKVEMGDWWFRGHREWTELYLNIISLLNIYRDGCLVQLFTENDIACSSRLEVLGHRGVPWLVAFIFCRAQCLLRLFGKFNVACLMLCLSSQGGASHPPNFIPFLTKGQ